MKGIFRYNRLMKYFTLWLCCMLLAMYALAYLHGLGNTSRILVLVGVRK